MAQLASSKKSGKNSKQVDNNVPKWRECNHSAAPNSVIVKHNQNNVCSRQNWSHSQSQAQFSPSADQLKISVKGQNPKRDTCYGRSRKRQAYPTHVPRQITWSAVTQHGCCSKSCDPAANFTSDHLPQTGVLIFDHAMETSEVKRWASHHLAASASAEPGSTNVTTPHYISVMLRRIRRELGVREPRRADREAQKRVDEMAGAETPQRAGGALGTDGKQGPPPIASAKSMAVDSAPVSSQVLYPDSDAGPSTTAPAEKSTEFKIGQEEPETGGVSSGFTGETGGAPNSKCAPSDPDVNSCNRVRIAHKPKQVLEEKQASSKLSCNGVKRKRPEEAAGMPR